LAINPTISSNKRGFMQHELIKLNNHLQTLFVDAPGSTAATVQIWFRAGSALEKKSNQGIAHFLEHMFFKGTPTRPGSAIAHEVESFGGEINAFTSFDYTCYYINTPNNHLTKTTEILLDMVSNPEFKQEDLVPERGVVFEEFRRSVDNPNQYAFHKLQKSAFTGGYAHPILGTEKNILSFSRDQLKDFRKNFYNLNNALLVVAGDVKNKEKIKKVIEGYKLPQGPRSEFPAFKLKSATSADFHEKDTNMVQLSLCFQAPQFEEGNAAAEDLAINCLGHGESSKLYQSLVAETSLATSCGSSTMFMNKGGLHYVKVLCPQDSIEKVFKKLESVILEVAKDGISENEVQKIKNQYIASKVYDMESIESYAFSMGHSFASTGDINSEEAFIQKIKSTTVEQVNTSLKEIFKRSMHLSLQTPLGQQNKKIEALTKKFQADLQKKISAIKDPIAHKYKVKKSKIDPQVELLTLRSGVKLIYRHNPMNPTFVLHAYLKGGITEETDKTNGLYHLISSTISKGYGKTAYKELKTELDSLSASLSSFSGKNAYGLTMHGQSEHFSALVDHFCGTLIRPSFKSDHLKHEKEIASRILKNHEKDPIKNCFKEVSSILFNGHPYSRSVLGNEKTLKGITAKLIKETHQANLKNKEILLTYCGDKSLAEVLSQLDPLLSQLKSRKEKAPKKGKVSPKKGEKKFIPFDREQTQIFTGIPTHPLGHKDNIALKIVTTHLSGQSSELFVEVRDKQGLCYTAQPIHFSALEAGYWGVYMASGHDKVEPALKAIQDILENIKTKGLKKADFMRVKKMIEGQSLLNIQTNDDYANIYSVTTLQGQDLDFYYDNNSAIEKLSYDEFLKTIKRIFASKWSTVIVGKSAPDDFS
jgi:zinc protease